MKKLKAMAMGASLILVTTSSFAEEKPMVMLFKSPACGCCSAWGKHMEENGFKVMNHDVQNVDRYKKRAGVPDELKSCHTAMIGDYVIEGHVPAKEVARLLTEKPEGVNGLAVSGMPMGSPGMDHGLQKDTYKVISFTKNGKTTEYTEY